MRALERNEVLPVRVAEIEAAVDSARADCELRVYIGIREVDRAFDAGAAKADPVLADLVAPFRQGEYVDDELRRQRSALVTGAISLVRIEFAAWR